MTIKISDTLTPECSFIRTEVFIKEQGFIDEFDELDDNSYHAILYIEGKAVAVGRLYEEDANVKSFRIGRIAVLKDYRKNNYGSMIVKSLEDKAKTLNARILNISSQVRAKGFYKTLGYSEIGSIYEDEGSPHILMQKFI